MPQFAARDRVNQQRLALSAGRRRTMETQAVRTMARPHARVSDPIISRAALPVSQVVTLKSSELERAPFRISARVPAALPATTPAWTTNGAISVGPTGLLMPRQQQERMIRHEAFHRLHQQNAPVSGSAGALRKAERLAARVEGGLDVSLPLPLPPAPALLAFPAQTHSPWNRVFIGDTVIIGEVTEPGMIARVLLSYKEIGIDSGSAPDTYHCGTHPLPSLGKVAADLRQAAKLAAVLNEKIPAGSLTRITKVLVHHGANSSFRMSGSEGVLVVKKEDQPWEQVVAHEGSHAIFAFHLQEKMTDGQHDKLGQGQPDDLAIEVGKIFLEMQNTAQVPIPDRHFKKEKPPLSSSGASTRPAGFVMVVDTLWSGTPGGHPWDTVDEFFSSAFGAFQQKDLFNDIVRHYSQADPRIPTLAGRLTSLFAILGDPTALAGLKTRDAPLSPLMAKLFPFMKLFKKMARDWTDASKAQLAKVQGTPKVRPSTDFNTALLADPSQLIGPRAPIPCPSSKSPKP